MNIIYFFTETGILTLSGIIIITAAYSLLKRDIQHYFSFKSAALKTDERSQLLNLKLNAYERAVLFIERINPANLFLRVYQQGISISDLQSILINEIRSEYQHNVTQQLYIDPTTWQVLKKLKDDTLMMINTAVRGLPKDASGAELSKKILQHIAEITDNPYDLTLELIKKDIQKLL